MKTAIATQAAAEMIGEGAVLLVGGFMVVGSPHRPIDALAAGGTGGLAVVCNGLGLPGKGVGNLGIL